MSLSGLFTLVPDVRRGCCGDGVGMAMVAQTCRWAEQHWRPPRTPRAMPLLEGTSKLGHVDIVQWILWRPRAYFETDVLCRALIHAMHSGSEEIFHDVGGAFRPANGGSFYAHLTGTHRLLFLSRALDIRTWSDRDFLFFPVFFAYVVDRRDYEMILQMDPPTRFPGIGAESLFTAKERYHHVLQQWERVIWAVREQVPRATQSEAESAVIMHGGDAVAAIMELTMG
jgi:hypothetical protein